MGSYDELLADGEIDAVYIPLPNELHLPTVFAAAEAGKHVLCEKPLALDADEAARMVEACHSRGLLLMEAFMWRFQPRTAALLNLVRSGRIGELRLIRSSFSFPIDPGDWRLEAGRGGGALWDVGCYGVSTARLFAGAEPRSIKSVAHFGPSGVDLSLAATLEFPGDILAAIDCSFEQPFRCEYELVGTKGVIKVPDAYLPPPSPLAELLVDSGSERLTFPGGNQYAAMVDAFHAALENGNRLPERAETGLGSDESPRRDPQGRESIKSRPPRLSREPGRPVDLGLSEPLRLALGGLSRGRSGSRGRRAEVRDRGDLGRRGAGTEHVARRVGRLLNLQGSKLCP